MSNRHSSICLMRREMAWLKGVLRSQPESASHSSTSLMEAKIEEVIKGHTNGVKITYDLG